MINRYSQLLKYTTTKREHREGHGDDNGGEEGTGPTNRKVSSVERGCKAERRRVWARAYKFDNGALASIELCWDGAGNIESCK